MLFSFLRLNLKSQFPRFSPWTLLVFMALLHSQKKAETPLDQENKPAIKPLEKKTLWCKLVLWFFT